MPVCTVRGDIAVGAAGPAGLGRVGANMKGRLECEG